MTDESVNKTAADEPTQNDEVSAGVEYWDMVESFIQLANEHLDRVDIDQVNAGILEAAAQFNAFVLASTENVEKEAEKKELLHEYASHYRKLLTQALKDQQTSN